MSSKTARLHRRQAARREQYRRLRKAGRVPQHTTAERRHAAAERKHQREAEAHRQWWHDRLSGSLAATVGAAAAGVVIAAPVATDGIGHLYKPYSVASRLYPWVLSSDDGSPDYPHVPEPDRTFYTPSYAAGTATTSIRIGPDSPSWDPWEYARGYLLGD